MAAPAHEADDAAAPLSEEAVSAPPDDGDVAAIDHNAAVEHKGDRRTMLPERRERPPLESAFVRVVATCGVIGIGVALGAILSSQHVAGWISGLVVAFVSVVISAVLWSSRRL
jgi:hypothetical protein